jgi:multiple sugar transport system ATP-binding protein
LFDEPLSNLNAKLRVQMRLELAKLHAELGTTMIYVTHDQTEAMTLADTIVVLDKGVVSRVGSPLELYNTPANKFVAAFIGAPDMNFFGVDIAAMNGRTASVVLPSGRTADIGIESSAAASPVELGVQPEHLAIVDPSDAHAAFAGLISIIEHLGNSTILYVDTPAGQLIVLCEGNLDANRARLSALDLTPATRACSANRERRPGRRVGSDAGSALTTRSSVSARCPDRSCRSRGRRCSRRLDGARRA